MGMAEDDRMTKVQAFDIILHRISWLEMGIEDAVTSGTMTLRDMSTLNGLRTALSDAKAVVKGSVAQCHVDSNEECERREEEIE